MQGFRACGRLFIELRFGMERPGGWDIGFRNEGFCLRVRGL